MEVLTVHGNELFLFGDKALPLLVLLMLPGSGVAGFQVNSGQVKEPKFLI